MTCLFTIAWACACSVLSNGRISLALVHSQIVKHQLSDPTSVRQSVIYKSLTRLNGAAAGSSLGDAPDFEGMKKKRFLGVIGHMRENAYEVCERHAKYCYENDLPGVVMDIGVLGKLLYIVEPSAVQYIMEDRPDIFYKSALDRRGVGLLTGRGVLLSDGADHTRKRRLILPNFDSRSLSGFIKVMEESTVELLFSQNMLKHSRIGVSETSHKGAITTIDTLKTMQSLAMKIVAKCLFSQDISNQGSISEQIDVCLEHVVYVSRHPFAFPKWIPTRRNRRFRRALKTLDSIVSQFIDATKERISSDFNQQGSSEGIDGRQERHSPDLLEMLLAARYDDGDGSNMGALTDEELRDEVMTLFLAGHDTTALALSWTLWFLSDPKHQVWCDRIRDEYNQVQQKGGFDIGVLQDPEAMKYTRAVLCESLRCRSPSWAIDREVQQDTVLPGNIQVRKKDLILVSAAIMHRNPKYFEHPDEWLPERFLEWSSSDPWDGPFSRSVYMPFGNGRKRCIGWRFAQWEMLIILSTIVDNVSIHRMPGQKELQVNAEITLRPEEGYQLRLKPREVARQLVVQEG